MKRSLQVNNSRVLILDIETAPLTVYTWGTKDQNIALNQIKDEWHLLAWAAKWLGEKNVIYMDQRAAKNVQDDKKILNHLWTLLNQADVVVTQNGVNFDAKKINARFIMHGMRPPKPYKHIDTYQIVRRVAAFTSNKLEYLTGKLCKRYKKLAHKEFPGFSLWTECLGGNRAAWNAMKKYNTHDVLSTEELFMKIRAWAPESMVNLFSDARVCRVCGKDALIKWGFRGNRQDGAFHRMLCKSCGAWSKLRIKR